MENEEGESVDYSDQTKIDVIKSKLEDKRFDIISNTRFYKEYCTTTKKTKNTLTKYEKAKLLSVRAQQISNGASPLLNDKLLPSSEKPYISPEEIAEIEFKEKRIPFIICRYLPNGECEYFRLEDFSSF